MTALHKNVILYIEDDPGAAHLVQKRMEKHGYITEIAENGKKGIEKFDSTIHDVLISDYRLPDMNGCELVKSLNKKSGGIPAFIVLTGAGDEKIAVEALKLGAADYIVKDTNQVFLELLPAVIESALFTKKLVEENKRQQKELEYYAKELEERNAELQKLSQCDSLTGLSNYGVFQEVMQAAIARANRNDRKMAVMMIDLDGFKAVNDTYGHIAGDLLLKEISNRFKTTLRESDHIARIGGDEFTVVLEDLAAAEDANIVATKLLNQMRYPIIIEKEELKITVSIGIATYPTCGKTHEELTKSADTAMYQAKKDPGNSYQFFTNELNKRSMESSELEKDMVEALKNDEFLLHFQPKYCQDAAKIIGFEALARWNHPEKGSIPPSVFIPIAERSGLIENLGVWSLEKACAQAKEWLDDGMPPMIMSVNVSPRQLRHKGFATETLEILARFGLNPAMLQLEITEAQMMKNLERFREPIEKLRKAGVRISIDDFGTGNASIVQMGSVPADEIKIDKSLIDGVAYDTGNASITSAVIDLAHHLDIDVVAEGVETREQLEFLQKNHCDYVQGYYLDKPMTADAISKQMLPPPVQKKKKKIS